MDSPWDESADNTFKDIEWSRISSEFTSVGSLILLKRFQFKRLVSMKVLLQERKLPYKMDLTLGLVIPSIGRELGGIPSAILGLRRSSTIANETGSTRVHAQEITILKNLFLGYYAPRS